jgi:hypothetical protein
MSGLKAVYRAKCRTSATPPNSAVVARLAAVDAGHLKYLDLSKIQVDATFFSLLECVVLASGVNAVDFSATDMTDEHVDTLCHHLFRAAAVEQLVLRDNTRISDIGARTLMDFVRHQPRVKTINVDGTSISAKMREVLDTALAANCHAAAAALNKGKKKTRKDLPKQESDPSAPSIMINSTPLERGLEAGDSYLIAQRFARVALPVLELTERVLALVAWEKRMTSFVVLVTALSCAQGSLAMTLAIVLFQLVLRGQRSSAVESAGPLPPFVTVGTDGGFAPQELNSLRQAIAKLSLNDTQTAGVAIVLSWLERARQLFAAPVTAIQLVSATLAMSLVLEVHQILAVALVASFLYFPLLRHLSRASGGPSAVRLRRHLAEMISPDRPDEEFSSSRSKASLDALPQRVEGALSDMTRSQSRDALAMPLQGSRAVGLPPRELLGFQPPDPASVVAVQLVCLEGRPPSGRLCVHLRGSDGDMWSSPWLSGSPWCWADDCDVFETTVEQTIRISLVGDEGESAVEQREALFTGKLWLDPALVGTAADAKTRFSVPLRRAKSRRSAAPTHFEQLVAEVHKYERDERRKYSLTSLEESLRPSSGSASPASRSFLSPSCTLTLVVWSRAPAVPGRRGAELSSASPPPKAPSVFGEEAFSEATSRTSSMRHF